MKARLSIRAIADLAAIYDESVARYGATQAGKYADGFTNTIAFLAEYPEAARSREELTAGTRAFRYQAHLIFYELEDDAIHVLRIRHGHEGWLSDF